MLDGDSKNPMCKINYRLSITYILPCYVFGHYCAKLLTTEM